MSPLTDDLVHFEFLSFFGKRGPKLDPVDTTLGPILQKKFFFPKDQPLGSKTTKFGEILIIFIANFFKFLITYEPGPAPIKSPTNLPQRFNLNFQPFILKTERWRECPVLWFFGLFWPFFNVFWGKRGLKGP